MFLKEKFMIVRDRAYYYHDLRGFYTDARDMACPCRDCYKPDDFGCIKSDGEWQPFIKCATREYGGCPDPLPEAVHILPEGKCKRRGKDFC